MCASNDVPSYSSISGDSSIISHHHRAHTDRHVSGLPSYRLDHSRAVFARDYDILGLNSNPFTDPVQKASIDSSYLHSRQDPEDYLTESESDDEGLYGISRPTDQKVTSVMSQSVNGQEGGNQSFKIKSTTPKITSKK